MVDEGYRDKHLRLWKMDIEANRRRESCRRYHQEISATRLIHALEIPARFDKLNSHGSDAKASVCTRN